MLYRDPADEKADVFQILLAEVEASFQPDYVLIDSRTGLADIAGVCTLELPQGVVAVTGLNEQNVTGMEQMLQRLQRHPARVHDVATLLVLSPVPRVGDLEPGLKRGSPSKQAMTPWVELERRAAKSPLLARLLEVRRRLIIPLCQEFAAIHPRFPGLDTRDLVHLLEGAEALATSFEKVNRLLPESPAERWHLPIIDRMAWKLWRTPPPMAVFTRLATAEVAR